MRTLVTADLIEVRRDWSVRGDIALLVFTDDSYEYQIKIPEAVLDDFLTRAIPRLRDWQREQIVRRDEEQRRAAGQMTVDDFA